MFSPPRRTTQQHNDKHEKIIHQKQTHTKQHPQPQQHDTTIQTMKAQIRMAKQSIQRLGAPNPVQAAISRNLIANVASQCHSFQSFAIPLLKTIDESVYLNPVPDPMDLQGLINHDTYLILHQKLIVKKRVLEDDIQGWKNLETMMEREIIKKKKLVKKQANKCRIAMLSTMFRTWRNICITKRHQRGIMDNCFSKFAKNKFQSIFKAWKKYTKDNKKTRALERIAELDKHYAVLRKQKQDLELQIRKSQEHILSWNKKLKGHTKILRGIEADVQDMRIQVQKHERRKEASLGDVMEWYKLCNHLVFIELDLLKTQLDAARPSSNSDLSNLASGGWDLDKFLEAPVDMLLYRWLAFHKITVTNLSSSLKNGEAYRGLLEAIADAEPNFTADFSIIDQNDEIRLVPAIAETLRRHNINIKSADIREGIPDRNFVALAHLFCKFPAMFANLESWSETQNLLEEVHKEFTALDERVNDLGILDIEDRGYWAKLTSRMDEVRRRVKWSFRESDQKSMLWNSVRDRVQQAAWHLMLERGRGNIVSIPDREANQEKQAFTNLDEEEFSSARTCSVMSQILTSNFKVLRRIYIHYSKFSLDPPEKPEDAWSRPALSLFGLMLWCKEIKARFSKMELHTMFYPHLGEGTFPKLAPKGFVSCLIILANEWYDGHSTATNLGRFFDDVVVPRGDPETFKETQLGAFRLSVWGDSDLRSVAKLHLDTFLRTLDAAKAVISSAGEDEEDIILTPETGLRLLFENHKVYNQSFSKQNFELTMRKLQLNREHLLVEDLIEIAAAASQFMSLKPLSGNAENFDEFVSIHMIKLVL